MQGRNIFNASLLSRICLVSNCTCNNKKIQKMHEHHMEYTNLLNYKPENKQYVVSLMIYEPKLNITLKY